MKKTYIYTDGACAPKNPGTGGWAFVCTDGERELQRGIGGEPSTTNNRMELKAAIEALSHTDSWDWLRTDVVIRSDSRYVVNGMTSWVDKWQRNGWKTKKGGDVLNRDLWEVLVEMCDLVESEYFLSVHFEWIRGHAGDRWNDLVDTLAENYATRLHRDGIVESWKRLEEQKTEERDGKVYRVTTLPDVEPPSWRPATTRFRMKEVGKDGNINK